MTKADPNPTTPKRGRHARSDEDDEPVVESPAEETDQPPAEVADEPRAEKPDGDEKPADTTAEPEPEPARATGSSRYEVPEDDAPPRRVPHAIGRHPAATPLLTAAGLVTGIGLAPLLLDRMRFGVALDAAANARSAAAPWPADAAPWFAPSWVAMLAFAVAAVVLLLALVGLRVPDVVVLGLGGALTLTTARAAWATVDVVDAGLWELVPLCILCVLAFGLSATATARWRSVPGSDGTGGEGVGGVAAAALAAWLVVVLVLLAGAAIAASARTHAFGDADSPPQGLAGLLSVRASDGPAIDGYRGTWMAQLATAQVADDDAASAFAVVHHDRSAGLPTLLVRGDDTGAPDLDDSWWVTVVAQSFGSMAEVENWCAENGRMPPDCVPRLITD